MYWKLKILYKDGRSESICIKRMFQQRPSKNENINNKLYYEDIYSERGRGEWLDTNDMKAWELKGE